MSPRDGIDTLMGRENPHLSGSKKIFLNFLIFLADYHECGGVSQKTLISMCGCTVLHMTAMLAHGNIYLAV